MSAARAWTESEVEALERLYPVEPWAVLKEALPGRTQSSVYKKAFKLGIEREKRDVPPEVIERLRQRLRDDPPHLGHVKSPLITRDGVVGRACVVCLEWKPLEKFARHATCAHGRRSICTTCAGRLAYERDPEARIATVRRYQRNHPEKTRELKRAGNRRRHKRKIPGPGVSAKQWREIRAAYGEQCAYCGEAATTMDHVVPLSRGGEHSPTNVVPACSDCNFKKHCKTPDEWRPLRPRKME